LWLRIAQANLGVSFLPNVLCLYRHHETSMSIMTNFFDQELVAHLYEKYHALIDTYPAKRRILGINRSQFEQARSTTSENRKCTNAACATSYLSPRTDPRGARSRPVSETDVQCTKNVLRARYREGESAETGAGEAIS